MEEKNGDAVLVAKRTCGVCLGSGYFTEGGNPVGKPQSSDSQASGGAISLVKARLMTVSELSVYAAIPVSSIYTYICTGKIPRRCVVRRGRSVRFDKREVDKWIDSQRGEA